MLCFRNINPVTMFREEGWGGVKELKQEQPGGTCSNRSME